MTWARLSVSIDFKSIERSSTVDLTSVCIVLQVVLVSVVCVVFVLVDPSIQALIGEEAIADIHVHGCRLIIIRSLATSVRVLGIPGISLQTSSLSFTPFV